MRISTSPRFEGDVGEKGRRCATAPAHHRARGRAGARDMAKRCKRDTASVANAVPRSAKSGAKLRRDGRAPKVAWSKCKSRGSEQTRSTSSSPRLPVLTTHTVLPGPVNLWSLFPRTYFFLPGAFFRKSVFRGNQVAPLRGGSVDGRKTFSGKKCPVKRNTFGEKNP